MTKMISKTEQTQVTCTRILFGAVVALILAYLYTVNSTAFSAAAQERFADEIAETQSTIGELELDYIEKNNTIHPELATEYGLVKMEKTEAVFVARNSTEKLSFNE